MALFEIHNRPAPASASISRRKSYVKLIVLHSSLAPAAESLAGFSAAGARSAPHFFIGADGAITRLVSERRAALHSGQAQWQNRTRNIDLISVGVMLEHRLDGGAGAQQLAALHWLLDQLQMFFGLGDAALTRWQPPQAGRGPGLLVPYVPLPPPPPARPPTARRSPATLGDNDDPQRALRLWQALQEFTHKQRNGSFHLDWAFHLDAAKFDLGAPMAPSSPTPVQAPAGSYAYQPFARDTVCNEGRNYGAVQHLSSLLGDGAPAGSLAHKLIEAGYQASLAASAARVPLKGNPAYHPEWKFHQVARDQRLGPPLSGNYATADGAYAVQVFALDTLYTPRSEITGCRRLSETPAGDPAYTPIWAETYAAIGGSYDPNAPFQQFAAANKLGAPLSMPQELPFEGASYTAQAFALDTLYAAAGGPIGRMSALPRPSQVLSWQPSAPAAPALAGATLVPGQAPGKNPERVQRIVDLAISLLGADSAGLAKYPQLGGSVTGGDIVCADLVTFCLTEAGVKLWGNVSDPTGSGRTGRRAANYYRPDPANQGVLREVTNEASWLPGDIMIYGIGDLSVDRAYHVNIYVGPFSYNGRTFDVVNASQDMPDISAMTKDYCVKSHCWAGHYQWTRRVRVLELEREFGG